MNQILLALQAFNFSDLSKKSIAKGGYTEHDLNQLKELDAQTLDYLDTRTGYLASITCAMQVSIEDKEVGTFDKNHSLSLAYYLEEEIDALGKVISLRHGVLFHLKEIEKYGVM